MPSAGRVGNFGYRIESALGTSSGGWYSIRTEDVPSFPTNDRVYVANSRSGYQNPYTVDKPVSVDMAREGEISFSTRIRRSELEPPVCVRMLESGGWTSSSTSNGTISAAGTDTLTSSSDIGDAGSVVGIECTDGLTRPALISSGTASPYTLAAATPTHNNGGEITGMFTVGAKTSYSNPYLVKAAVSGRSLQFRYISSAPHNDTPQNLYNVFTGCALASVAPIEIGAPGTFPLFDMTFHGFPDVATAATGSALADSFSDTAPFGVVTPSIEFQYGAASGSSLAAALYNIETVSIDLGITTVPVWTNGSGSTVGGVSAYISVPAPPKITITTAWDGLAAFERGWFSNLDTNESKYLHIVQPTSNPGTSPCWGFFMPNAHIDAEGEPTVDYSGDIVKASVTFTGSRANYGDEDIDSALEAPIYFAVG